MSDHLTEPNPDLAKMVRKTPLGMAYWAGSGPAEAACGKCQYYGYTYPTGPVRQDGTRRIARKTMGCALYWKKMHTHPDVGLPADTAACKYFERAVEQT